MFRDIIAKISRTRFVCSAIADEADLSALKERPSARIIIGMGVIAFSYLAGWPLIGVLGALSIYWGQPLLIVIGGPVAYILSHLIFWMGMYLAGMRYSRIILRWLTRIAMIRLMKLADVPLPPCQKIEP